MTHPEETQVSRCLLESKGIGQTKIRMPHDAEHGVDPPIGHGLRHDVGHGTDVLDGLFDAHVDPV